MGRRHSTRCVSRAYGKPSHNLSTKGLVGRPMRAACWRHKHKLHLAFTKYQESARRSRELHRATLPIRVSPLLPTLQAFPNTWTGPWIASPATLHDLSPLLQPPCRPQGRRDFAQAVPCLSTLSPDRGHSLPQLFAPTSSPQRPSPISLGELTNALQPSLSLDPCLGTFRPHVGSC